MVPMGCHYMAVEKGRDTYGHDGKSFIAARSQIVHEKYEEILQQQSQTQCDIDHFQAYYQVTGRQKKKRTYGLGFHKLVSLFCLDFIIVFLDVLCLTMAYFVWILLSCLWIFDLTIAYLF